MSPTHARIAPNSMVQSDDVKWKNCARAPNWLRQRSGVIAAAART